MDSKKTSPNENESDGFKIGKSCFVDESSWKTFTLDGDALLDIADCMRCLHVPKYRFDFKNVLDTDNITPVVLSVFRSFGKEFNSRTMESNLKIVNANEKVAKFLREKGIDAYFNISNIPFPGLPEMPAANITADPEKAETGDSAKTDYHTILFPGNITGKTADILMPLLDDIIDKGCSNCIFNLSRVNDIDLSGLSVMNSFGEKIVNRNKKRRIGIINANEDIANLFLKTGIDHLYSIQ